MTVLPPKENPFRRFFVGFVLDDVQATKPGKSLEDLKCWVTKVREDGRQNVVVLVDALDIASVIVMITEYWEFDPVAEPLRFARTMADDWTPSNRVLYRGNDDPGVQSPAEDA